MVGVVHKPELLATQVWTVYVPLRTLQHHLGPDWDQPPGYVTRVTVELKPGTDPRKWADRFAPQLQKIDPGAELALSRDSRAEVDKNLGAVRLLSYIGGTISMLAATFIVFSALSMGVSERQRVLAMVRAVGAYRGQVAALVLFEGMLLSLVGVAVGVPMGLLWVKILTWIFNDIFAAGLSVDWWGVLLGSGGSVLTALAAGALPAWLASRVSPLEAMNPDSAPSRPRTPYLAAAAGLVLVAIDPFLFFGPLEAIARLLGSARPEAAAQQFRFYAHFLLGLPGVMVGFFLLAPLVVRLIEHGLGPSSRGPWRSARRSSASNSAAGRGGPRAPARR